MAGQHALAGDRRQLESTARWYERLRGCCRDSRSTSAPSSSAAYEFELRWGRVHSLVIHCDSQRLQHYCDRLVACGVARRNRGVLTDVR